MFKGKEYTIIEATPDAFEGINIVLASAGGSTSLALAHEAVKRGCVYIDNSSAFRMEKDIPLVIAGVNDDDIKTHKGIIANPNCSTSQLMLALKPLHDFAGIKRMVVSTYQSVSGAGLAAINELRENTIAVGDSNNDYDMLTYAGIGVAMANSQQSILDIADYVTDSNLNCGVAKAIEKFLP